MLRICLHAAVANCELTKDFPSVTSPLSPPCSADLRYPVMESNERHKKVDNSFLFYYRFCHVRTSEVDLMCNRADVLKLLWVRTLLGLSWSSCDPLNEMSLKLAS